MSKIPIDAKGGKLPHPRMESWSSSVEDRQYGEKQRAEFHKFLNPQDRLSMNNNDGVRMVDSLITTMTDPYGQMANYSWSTRLQTDPVGEYLVREWMPSVIKQQNLKFGVNLTREEVSQEKGQWLYNNLVGLRKTLEQNAGMQGYNPVKWAQTYDETTRAKAWTVNEVQKKIAKLEEKKRHDQSIGFFDEETYGHEMETLTFNLDEAKAGRDKAVRDYQQKVLRVPSHKLVTMTRQEMDDRFNPQIQGLDIGSHIADIRASHDTTTFNQNLSHYLRTMGKDASRDVPQAIGALFHLSFNMSPEALTLMAMPLGLVPPQTQDDGLLLRDAYQIKALGEDTKNLLRNQVHTRLYPHVNDLSDQVGLDYGTKNKIDQGFSSLILWSLQNSNSDVNSVNVATAITNLIDKDFTSSVVADVPNAESIVISAGALTGPNAKMTRSEIKESFTSFGSMFQDLRWDENFKGWNDSSYDAQFKLISELSGLPPPKNSKAVSGTKAKNILTNLGHPSHLAFTQNKRAGVPRYSEINGKELKFLEVSPEQYSDLSRKSRSVFKETLRDEHIMTALVTQMLGSYQLTHAFGSIGNLDGDEAEMELSSLGLSDTSEGREMLRKIKAGKQLGVNTRQLRDQTSLEVNAKQLKEHTKLTRIGDNYAFTYLHPKNETMPYNRVYLKDKDGNALMFSPDEIANAIRSAKQYQKRMTDMISDIEMKEELEWFQSVDI